MSLSLAPATRDRLRIAIQKNGRLSEPASALLSACGLKWRQSRDKLFCYGESLPIDLLLVRDDDIPGLIAEGVCDFGIVGLNELKEQAAERQQNQLPALYREWRNLDFGSCRLMLAVPEEWQWESSQQLAKKRIATSYPAILTEWLNSQNIDAQVVELSGSVEIAPKLGTADAICDLVSSGATLAANQLKAVETILESQAVLAGPMVLPEDSRAGLASMLLRRMDGVLQLKEHKLVQFKAEPQQLAEFAKLLPDASPFIELPNSQFQTLCQSAISWQCLEALEQAGAREINVFNLERSLG